MKRMLFHFSWGLMLVAGIIFLSSPGASAQGIQMKFAHFGEETHPSHLAAKQFAA